MLIHNPAGHYSFLHGIDPYSCGVIADEGFEIVHVTLACPLPWREGMNAVSAYLKRTKQPKKSLCGVELRCPEPYSMRGFIAFNREYCRVLQEWGLFVDGRNPLARTNIAPLDRPADMTQELVGFSHIEPLANTDVARTFVVAGAGELVEGKLDSSGIIRRGETTADALLEKAEFVAKVMRQRVEGLGADPHSISRVNVYTAQPIDPAIAETLSRELPAIARVGLNWYPSKPPVKEIDFEMDLRGIAKERRVLCADGHAASH